MPQKYVVQDAMKSTYRKLIYYYDDAGQTGSVWPQWPSRNLKVDQNLHPMLHEKFQRPYSPAIKTIS